MQKQSLGKLAAYWFLSLGLYQLVWFARTRQELMKLTGVRIPRVGWVAGLVIFNLATFCIVVYAVIFLLAPNQQATVSQTCWQQYVVSTSTPDIRGAFTRANGSPLVYTPVCQQEIAKSQQVNHRQSLGVWIVLAGLLVSAAALLGFFRWLNYYTAAVSRVSRGKLSHNMAMLYLGLLPYCLGMILVQDIFNKVNSQFVSPAPNEASLARTVQAAEPSSAAEGPAWLKKTLVVVIVIMLTLLIGAVGGMYLLMR